MLTDPRQRLFQPVLLQLVFYGKKLDVRLADRLPAVDLGLLGQGIAGLEVPGRVQVLCDERRDELVLPGGSLPLRG